MQKEIVEIKEELDTNRPLYGLMETAAGMDKHSVSLATDVIRDMRWSVQICSMITRWVLDPEADLESLEKILDFAHEIGGGCNGASKAD